ncbi:intercellular adhesion molecule 2-like [Misgurnus anguillicaudatus]|uniref:intercellular adhesion molecule 2-like n=1 Tax=Misgurnus anguillicaudatus TaxID=75329 RepID=UPI003CCF2F68
MLQSLFGLFYLSALSQLVTLTGARAECPIKLKPPSVVVEYGSSVSVDCSTDVTHDGMGWEAPEGSVPKTTDKLITWRVSNLTKWDIRPQCYMSYNRAQCSTFLPITIYKTPDSVFISTVDHAGPMTEGSWYEFQCVIMNVAPVKNLTVKWFKGETEVHSETFNDTIKTPVSETSTLDITAVRSDDGVQYRCEAELELGADGPQPPPKVKSKSVQITVQYSPRHIDLVEIIKKRDGDVTLNCTVPANPPATYSWYSEHLTGPRNSAVFSSSKLTPGNYTCTATNTLGNSNKVFIVNFAGSLHTFIGSLIFLPLLVALGIVV